MMLQQPWAQTVVEGALPCLIRRSNTKNLQWVGVYATKEPDRRVATPVDNQLRHSSIVGAVRISESVEITGDPRDYLANEWGSDVADFYPSHFIPVGTPRFAWVFSESLVAEPTVPWRGPIAKVWSTTPTTLEGRKFGILEGD